MDGREWGGRSDRRDPGRPEADADYPHQRAFRNVLAEALICRVRDALRLFLIPGRWLRPRHDAGDIGILAVTTHGRCRAPRLRLLPPRRLHLLLLLAGARPPRDV